MWARGSATATGPQGQQMTPWRDKVFIVAEAGVNHNGDPQAARALIDAAATAGCDAVKFQTFRAEALAAPHARTAAYQKANGAEDNQLDMLRRLELPYGAHQSLQDHAGRKGILFFSTAFDPASVDFLQELDIPVWKIPSGEITNYPFLVRAAGMGKPILLSTGMSTTAEIQEAVGVLTRHGASLDSICILHCNTEYPTAMRDVNLRAMAGFGAAFGTVYGYSDHTLGHTVAVAAVALGARVVEKHLTLDRTLPGPDHQASLEPGEMSAMVAAVREAESAMGDGIKRPSPSEEKNKAIARKSLIAARPIRAGEVFSADNIAVKRPGTGLSPMRWNDVMGKTAPRDFAPDELIEL
jgi:N,N'-diacetyllegionaminate synthase